MVEQNSLNSNEQPQDPMRRIFESLPVGLLVFRLDSDGTLIFSDINAAADNMMNLTARDLLGKRLEDAFPFLVDSGTGEILKKIATDDTLWYDEEFTISANGSNLVFEVNAFQIAQATVAACLVDVTKRKEFEKLLEIENERLKEIDKMRKDFVSMTTHELKTPLSSMIGASEFLISYYKDLKDDEILNFIEMIHRGSMRLKTMINDLLAAYRIEESKLILDKKDVDIVDIVGRVIKDTTFLFKHRKQEVSYDLPEKCIANVDPFKLEQVITNLLQNACKNTPTGNNIHIKIQENDGWISVSVIDTGIGLEQDEMEKLFQKFGKLIRHDVVDDIETQGTGLGLFISKQIIEAHGGTIWAESEGRGKGSTFTFTIPKISDPDAIIA
ncbi:MAG TPA: ATP-binding protein [Candidatus Lokiarchaeia archaeon]|nr:ATP-binding protein [Candidatus Lokiarchaeia archaeon]